ncbi:hypothetical protein [Microcystis phage Mel-JY34]
MNGFEVHPTGTLAAMQEQIAQNRAANRKNAAILEQWRAWSWNVLNNMMHLGHHKDVLRKELRHASQALARISETHPEYREDYEQAVKALEETK